MPLLENGGHKSMNGFIAKMTYSMKNDSCPLFTLKKNLEINIKRENTQIGFYQRFNLF